MLRRVLGVLLFGLVACQTGFPIVVGVPDGLPGPGRSPTPAPRPSEEPTEPGGAEQGGRLFLWTTWKRDQAPPRGLRTLWKRIDGLYIQAPAADPDKPYANPPQIVRVPGDRGAMTVADQHAAWAKWYFDLAVREGADPARLELVIAPNGIGKYFAPILPGSDLRTSGREIESFARELMSNLSALGLPLPDVFHLDIEIGQQVGANHHAYTHDLIERVVAPAIRRGSGVQRVTNYRTNDALVTYDFRGRTGYGEALRIAASAEPGQAVWVRPDQLSIEEVRRVVRAARDRGADVILFNDNWWVLWDRVLEGLDEDRP